MARCFVCALIALVGLGLLGGNQAQAQVGPELFKPWDDKRFFEIDFQGQVQFGGEAEETDDDFNLIRYESKGRLRFDNSRNQGIVSIGYALDYLAIDTDQPRLDDYSPLDIAAGIAVPIYQVDAWSFGATLGAGYAGTSPFSDADAIYVLASVNATYTINENMKLYMALEYNGNRSVFPDVPLPGVIFEHKVNDQFTYRVGLPFSGIEWKPLEGLTVTASYTIPLGYNVRVGYMLFEGFEIYAMSKSSTKAFNLDGEARNRRLFFSQRVVELGFNWELFQAVELSFAAGYAFTQEFTTGFHTLNDDDLTDISNEPYIRIKGTIFF